MIQLNTSFCFFFLFTAVTLISKGFLSPPNGIKKNNWKFFRFPIQINYSVNFFLIVWQTTEKTRIFTKIFYYSY